MSDLGEKTNTKVRSDFMPSFTGTLIPINANFKASIFFFSPFILVFESLINNSSYKGKSEAEVKSNLFGGSLSYKISSNLSIGFSTYIEKIESRVINILAKENNNYLSSGEEENKALNLKMILGATLKLNNHSFIGFTFNPSTYSISNKSFRNDYSMDSTPELTIETINLETKSKFPWKLGIGYSLKIKSFTLLADFQFISKYSTYESFSVNNDSKMTFGKNEKFNLG